MKYLPTESITYKTKLKEDEILKRLSELIEPEKTFRFGVFGSRSTKPYEGRITGTTFDIRRIINYRNSFLPKITGVIEKDYDGININVKMKLHTFVIVFLWFFCGGVGIACIAILTKAIRNAEISPAVLAPFVILLFTYGLTMGAFKFESNISKKDLQKVFEADIVEGFSDPR